MSWIALLTITARSRNDRAFDRPRFCYGRLLLLLALLMGLPLGYTVHTWRNNNFHAVVPGQVYRSGQMDAARLARAVEQCGIKSVLNLRGENRTSDWYRSELDACARLGVIHYDQSLDSGQELSLEQMDDLVALLRQMPKPILIHCDGGADRSGLVSALYRLALEGRTAKEADRELLIWYGHVPLIRPKVKAMDRSFWRYVSNHVSPFELNFQPDSFSQ